jgi:hypothetical protein
MNNIVAPHLNPLLGGERWIRQRVASVNETAMTVGADSIRLSLCQRERMKVRDCFCGPLRQTKLLAERCRVLHEFDDSKIAGRRFHGRLEIGPDHGLACDQLRSCGLHHQAQRRVSRQGSKSRGRKDQSGAAGGTCIHRNFDFADAAKEFAQLQFPSHAASEHESRQNNIIGPARSRKANVCFMRSFSAPHLSPLPATGERRMTRCSIDAEGKEQGHRPKTLVHIAAPLAFQSEVAVRDWFA